MAPINITTITDLFCCQHAAKPRTDFLQRLPDGTPTDGLEMPFSEAEDGWRFYSWTELRKLGAQPLVENAWPRSARSNNEKL